MRKDQTLRVITYSLISTVIGLNININKVFAESLSARECQIGHERIAQRYAQSQPSFLNSNAYQRWSNSLMSAIRQFEAENPECERVTRNTRQNSNSRDIFREQIEKDTEFRTRQMCWGYGGEWDSRRKKCYHD